MKNRKAVVPADGITAKRFAGAGAVLYILLGCGTHHPIVTARADADNYKAYQLIWADEFNKDGAPDPHNWRYENGFVRNEEAQWYQQDNAFCKSGLLIIEGRKEEKPNPVYEAGSADWRKKRSGYSIYVGKH